ncbi:MAG: SDR family NAD(P)-dependent oxidoreductase, partial [Pseudomonadota bacterium]
MTSVCAIVGAGEGLGAALAARFARGGYDMALISRSEAGSADALAAAQAEGTSAKFFQGDANEPESIEAALIEAREIGQIDVMIYNVRGGFPASEPLDMTYKAMEEVHRLEVVGAFAAAKAVLPDMRARGSGRILFSSATAAYRGSAGYPLYAIGKFGLRALSQSLAKAYANEGVHIVHVRLDCDLDVPIMRKLYGNAYDPA